MTNEIQRKRFQSSDAIVFDGPSNARNDGAIHFPEDNNDDVDLSGSFTLMRITTTTPMQFVPLPLTDPSKSESGTFANCGSLSRNGGVVVETSASSGTITYPNGTQISYSKCEVVQIIHKPS